ncbi:MAG: type II secretion system F family protein [Planctomycetaceae bacterium]|nr:type II secretion system F family protein [Planctomycetaceae bacterium]
MGLIPLPFILFVPLTIGVMYARGARSQLDQGAILWTIASSLRTGRDLIAELEILRESLSSRYRRRVNQLIPLLSSGTPLAKALGKVSPRIIPAEALLMLRAGEENGYLEKAATDAAVEHSQKRTGRSNPGFSPTMATIYLTFIPLIGLFIVFGLCTWIVPKFKEIFEGFDTELPGQTVAVIDFADFLTSTPWGMLIFLLLFVGGVFAAIASFIGFRELATPFAGRLLKRLDVPGLLRIFASTTEADKSLEQTATMISIEHPHFAVRECLKQVDQLSREGRNFWGAMRQSQLITRDESALLNTAKEAGNLPWVLRQLADSLERRTRFRAIAALEFAQPAVVLVMGLLTFFVCVGFFLPLVKLVNDLS